MRARMTLRKKSAVSAAVVSALLSLGFTLASPALAADVTIDTFPSTSQIQPLVANPAQDPGLIGQAVVVPSGSPVLTQFSLEIAADAGATGTITVQAVVLPFDATSGVNTGGPVFVSDAVAVTNTTRTRLTFSTGSLVLIPGDTYLLGLTTVLQTQTTTNQGALGITPDSRYLQGNAWRINGGQSDLSAGKTFTALTGPDNVLAFSAQFTSNAPSGAAPPDWLQQVGVPASGNCADVDDEALNRGGASSGGWGRSWAQWMNDGLGGAVCTRSLMYVGGGRWAVRPS